METFYDDGGVIMNDTFLKVLSIIESVFKLIQKVLEDGRIAADDLITVAQFLHDEFNVPVEIDLNEFRAISEKHFGTDG